MSETSTHGTASQRGTVTSANGSAICEMSSFISKQKSLTWTSLTELDCYDEDTREGMTAGVKYLLKSFERAMGMEDATKQGHVQEFFHKKLQRRPRQPMAEWVNVFVKAMLDMKVQGLNVELKSMSSHLIEKSSLTLDRQERVLGAAEANTRSLLFEGR